MSLNDNDTHTLPIVHASAFINSEIIKSLSFYLEDGVQDKSNKGAGVLGAVSSGGSLQEFSIVCIKVPEKKHLVLTWSCVDPLFGNILSSNMINLSCRDLPITPQLFHHVFYFLGMLNRCHLGVALGSKLSCIHLSKLLQGEGPTMKSRTKADSTNDRVNLETKKLTMRSYFNLLIPITDNLF